MLAATPAAPADTFGTGGNQISVDFVPISGASNPASGYGIVPNDYRISKYKVTKTQWDKFAASLGVTVTGNPWYAYDAPRFFTAGNVPMNNVSWYQAAQFVNWLNTSTGHHVAYKFTSTQGTSDYAFAAWSAAEAANGTNLYRHKDAFYFLPTEHEWVKAAYWNGTTLQTYATKAGESLTQGNGTTGSGWNFYNNGYATSTPGPWPVGSGSQELNGTYDMMGSTWEWMESPNNDAAYGAASARGLRGGSFSYDASGMASTSRGNDMNSPLSGDPGHGYDYDIGFRVASLVGTPLIWSGSVSGVWDVNTTANFSGSASGMYSEGDYVTFSNAGSITAIQIAPGGVAPRSLVFSNTTGKDYAFTGGPIMGQTDLLVAGGGRVTLSAANTYTGGTTVSAGTLLLGVQDGVADNTALSVSGGTLDLGGFTKTTTATVALLGGVTQNGSIINNGAAYDAQAGTVTANLSGSAGLNKTTGGTLTLSGTNTYSGPTTVSYGTLALPGSLKSTGAVAVQSGAILSGSGSMGDLTVASGAHLVPGSSGTLAAGSMILNAGSIVDYSGGAANVNTALSVSTAPGSVIVNLAANLPPGTYTLFNYGTLTPDGASPWNPQSAFVMGTGTGNYIYTFTNPAGKINLVIADPPSVTWSGGGSDSNWSRPANWSPSVSLGGSEAITFAGSGVTTVNDVASGQFRGFIFASGAGAFTLTGNAVSLANDVINNSSNLQTINLNLTLQQATSFTTNGGGGNLTIGGIIAGGAAAPLTKLGSGTLVLSGSNTYTGGTFIAAGILQANNSAALGGAADSITFSGGTLQYTAASASQDWGSRFKYSTTAAINLDTNGQSVSLAGGIDASNTAGLVKSGSGTLNLSGSNTYLGGTTLTAGTVNASGTSPLSNGSLTLNNPNTGSGTALVLNINSSLGSGSLSGSLATPATGTNTATIAIANGQTFTVNQSADTIYAGTLTGSGSFARTGSGLLTLSGANTYTGTTSVTAGILKAGVASVANISGAFGKNSALTLANTAGAAIDLNGYNTQIGSLAGGGAAGGNVILGTATLTSGANHASTTYSGVISGSGNLYKTGSGTLYLTNANNSFTGNIVIDGGRLQFDVDRQLGATPGAPTSNTISILNGGTLYCSNGGDNGGNLSGNRGIYLGPGTQYLTCNSGDWHVGPISGPGGLSHPNIGQGGYRRLYFDSDNTYYGNTTWDATDSTSNYGAIDMNWHALALQYSALDANSVGGALGVATQSGTFYLGGLVNGNRSLANLTGNAAFTGLVLNVYDATAIKTFTNVIGGTNENTTTVTKTGPGTQVLGGINTYTGLTLVTGGKLTISATGTINASSGVSIGAGEFNYNSATALSKSVSFSTSGGILSGSGTITPLVTVSSNNTLAPGNSAIGTLSFGTGLSLAGSYAAQLGTPGTTPATGVADRAAVTGNLTLTGGALALSDNAGGNGQGALGAGAYRLLTFTGTRTGSFASVSNPLAATLHESVIYNDAAKSVDLNVYRLAAALAPAASVNLGNARVGGNLTGSATVSNTAASDGFSELLKASVTGDGSGFSGVAGGASGTLIFSKTASTAGAQSGSASVVLKSTGAGTYGDTTLSTTTVALGGAAYDFANAIYSGGTLAFGNVHQGATTPSRTLAIGNQTVTAANYQDLLDVAATTTNTKMTATGFTALAASINGTATGNLSIAADTSTVGSLAGTVNLTLTSNSNGVLGLTGGAASVVGTPGPITTSGLVYSGLMEWVGTNIGNWENNALWNDSLDPGVHAAPGLDAGFLGVDTASFGGTAGAVTVNLDGAAPSLNALSFDATGTCTLAQGSGSTGITLAGLAPRITVAGVHTISAPLTLASTTAVTTSSASDSLSLSGVVSGNGLTKDGDGTLTLSGASTYSGGTSVSNGTLLVNNSTGSGVGSGALSVASGAILGGDGIIGASSTLQGIHAPGNNGVGLQSFTNSLTYAATSHLQWQLTDNLSTGPGTSPGTAFDGVNVTSGSFAITPGATIDLSFAGLVDFTQGFWDASQTWTVVDLFSAVSDSGGSEVFALGAINGGGYNLRQGNFSVTRVADADSKNDVVLLWTAATISAPYQTWIDRHSDIPVAERDPQDDPDHDGCNNLAEYAFYGNPNDAADKGKMRVLTVDANADSAKELILTLAVRWDAVFSSGNPGPATATLDGLNYQIEGSTNLSGWLETVTVVDPVTTGLPVLTDTDYTYASFRLSGSSGLPAAGYLRARVSE
jgi:autotransporter-associated beta strand protein